MKGNKFGVLFIISVMALAGVGASYASWFDEVIVTGTVNTGHLRLELVEISETYVYKDTIDHTCEVFGEPQQTSGTFIEVAKAYWKTIPPANSVPGPGTYEFEFDNIFPCVDFEVNLLFHLEAESIPGRLVYTTPWYYTNVIIDGVETDVVQQLKNEYINSNGVYGMHYGLYWADADGNYIDKNGDNIVPDLLEEGAQIHGCEYFLLIVWIHLPQWDWLMDLDWTMGVTFEVGQWNHYVQGQSYD